MSANTGFHKGQVAYMPQAQLKEIGIAKNQALGNGEAVTTNATGHVIKGTVVADGPTVYNDGVMITNFGGSVGNTASDVAGQVEALCMLGKGRIIVECAAGLRSGNSVQTIDNSVDKFQKAVAAAPLNTIVGTFIEVAGNTKLVTTDGDLGVIEVRS